MKRSVLLSVLVAVLAAVFWMTGPAEAVFVPPRPSPDASCCTSLQGQSCSWSPSGQNTVSCSWGFYGQGYCQCSGTWGCYSSQPIPANPTRRLC
jgi:hypothetical protein